MANELNNAIGDLVEILGTLQGEELQDAILMLKEVLLVWGNGSNPSREDASYKEIFTGLIALKGMCPAHHSKCKKCPIQECGEEGNQPLRGAVEWMAKECVK